MRQALLQTGHAQPKTSKKPKSHTGLQTVTFADGGSVLVDIKINRRAKRIILRLDQETRTVKATCPAKKYIKEAIIFVHQRQGWIEQQLRDAPLPVPFAPGETIIFQGKPYLITSEPGRACRVTVLQAPPRLLVMGRDEHIARRLGDWLQRQAKIEIEKQAYDLATRLGLSFSRLKVRNMKTRWGSCSSDGILNFNWRLILAPPYVLRYVVAHEIAHLRHLNHSPAFWRTVDELDPHNQQARDWIDKHGANLWAYGAKTGSSSITA